MIKYSIIICTYNRIEYISETVSSIYISLKDRADYELLIIDNNSNDGTGEVLSKLKKNNNLRCFCEIKQGLSHARNRGIVESKGEVLIFLDDDIEVPTNYFSICDKVFENPDISISGGKVLPYNVEIPHWLPKKYYFLVSVYDMGDKPKYVQYLMGGNFAIRHQVAAEIGLYNTVLGRNGKILSGGEEIDYQNRAAKLGYKMYYHPLQLISHKINQKLNTDYVLNYAYELGKSEKIIDNSTSQIRVVKKLFKSNLAILFHYFFVHIIKIERAKVYLQIINCYGKGYIKA
jgi:glycosyltransferase involved in cell wall biosynthesis